MTHLNTLKDALKDALEAHDFTQNTHSSYLSPASAEFTKSNYGPVIIPQKNSDILLTMNNINLYKIIISKYEHNKLRISTKNIYINDTLTNHYRFKMNCYFVMGDNRTNSIDSRDWGLLREQSIIGKVSFVLLSIDKEKKWLNAFRWDRMFNFNIN